MKVLFINMSDLTGGAAIAATRLSIGLGHEFKTENYFLVRSKVSNYPNVFPTRKNNFETFIEKWVNIASNVIGLQYQYLPFSPGEILKKAKEIKPDIISLHNTLGGYFTTSLLVPLSKIAPVVWTLHDMWAFTGNSAHTLGDESWKYMDNSKPNTKLYPFIGINTGKLLLKQKKRIYEKSDLTIITPSKWLYNLAVQSPVFEGKKIEQIYNGIDLNIFKPMDKSICKEKLGIPGNEKVLMFSAEKLDKNPYKGGKYLIEVIKELSKKINNKINLLMLGKGRIEELDKLNNIGIHYFGYTKSEQEMAEYLSASDLFIYSTQADTLPNSLIESIACGTPAISFEIGGCPEIIQNNISGFTIKPFDVNEFVSKTIDLLFDKNTLELLSKSSRELAEKEFSLSKMTGLYNHLFESKVNIFKLQSL